MFGIKTFRFGTLAGIFLAGSFAASAATVDFSSALGIGNLPQSMSLTGLTASGWAVSKLDNTQWSNAVILNNRQEGVDERGLGVCANPKQCPATGNGNINEIDNNGSSFDVIRLDFGTVTDVTSIGLSSLDNGSKDGFAIFGSNTALPNLSLITPIAQGTNQSVGQVNPVIAINQNYRYFFVTPKDRSVNSSGSDFLLKGVNSTTIVTAGSVPEPYTAGLLAVGLLGIVALRFRSAQRLG